jgi:hypothetical protein
MAKHYYSIELVAHEPLDEEEVADLEATILNQVGGAYRITTEYVDSEG